MMDGAEVAEGGARLSDASALRVWRLSREGRAPGHDDPESCLGGGRWNSPGVAAFYCASTLPLAVLESWVHVPREERAPDGLPAMVAVCLELPSGALVEDAEAAEGDARAVGDDWARSGRSLALRVPSAVVPQERNVVLNPDHPQYGALRVVSMEPFPLDPRLAAAGD